MIPDHIHTSKQKTLRAAFQSGFTIVELLIVIIVIAILAAIVVVAYNGITSNARKASLQSDLESASAQLARTLVKDSEYPEDIDMLKRSESTTFSYQRYSKNSFCLEATDSSLSGVVFHITHSASIQEGVCPEPEAPLVAPSEVGPDGEFGYTLWVELITGAYPGWTEPVNNGGSPVTQYRLRFPCSGGSQAYIIDAIAHNESRSDPFHYSQQNGYYTMFIPHNTMPGCEDFCHDIESIFISAKNQVGWGVEREFTLESSC